MIMNPSLRKFALTAHVTFSVGWLGSVAAFLALAISGLVSQNSQSIVAYYVAMDLITRFVILPLCFASLISGLVQGFVTHWGIFRHYWVVFKLLISILSTVILLVHMRPIAFLAKVAAEGALANPEHRQLMVQLVFDSSAAIVALLVAVGLSIYKPQGLTKYGRRKIREQKAMPNVGTRPL